MLIGKSPMKSSRTFPPAHTVRAPFDAHGAPSYFVKRHLISMCRFADEGNTYSRRFVI